MRGERCSPSSPLNLTFSLMEKEQEVRTAVSTPYYQKASQKALSIRERVWVRGNAGWVGGLAMVIFSPLLRQLHQRVVLSTSANYQQATFDKVLNAHSPARI